VVVTWSTDVVVYGVKVADFDTGARAAFVVVTREGMGDEYGDIVVLSIVDWLTNATSKRHPVVFLRSEAVSTVAGAFVTFVASHKSHEAMDEAAVQSLLSAYEHSIVHFYANTSTAVRWVQKSIDLGSATVDHSTRVEFGQPAVNYSSVHVVTAENTLLGANEAEITNNLLIITLPIVICVLFILICIVSYIKRRRVKRDAAIELSSLNLSMKYAAQDDVDKGGEVVAPVYTEEEDEHFEESEFDAALTKQSKLKGASNTNSLLAKVKSNKDKVMRKRGNRYAKI
jgi:hypothetical protein